MRPTRKSAEIEDVVVRVKELCLDRMILFGESPVRKAIAEFMVHYHSEHTTKVWTMH